MSPLKMHVNMLQSDHALIMSSFPEPSPSSKRPTENCKVCGDRPNNDRYGASACLGCTVFFRRAVVKNLKYKCMKEQNCLISCTYRNACRYCRFQKCFAVGMHSSAIQRRDLVGPRKISGDGEVIICENNTFLDDFASFQRTQFAEHLQYFTEHQVDVAFHVDQANVVKFRRRARAHDVNVMLKLCLKQATEWANRLKLFKSLPAESKRSILAEYCLAFNLIDQGYKTSKEADLGIWLLQNGSFMHPDYFFGLNVTSVDEESMKVKIQLHHNFVAEMINCLSTPFRRLEIDEVECAALKVILLLTPSCSKRAIYAGREGVLAGLYTNCTEELMDHCMRKFPENGAVRFGEILLLLSGIRCGIKTMYNQTRVSDLFNFMKFDNSVKSVLLS
ncbi:Nuclear Hormone Receptor family [Caenorhabditis elegans]|uniref:Nuclear Hormone Receptor family n=1 Tax=Caenorhabditis elegans TaxID=6239 RepID=O45328_CAEEL|nr:Nuclear Hormone Receptor family [Caenorhabditis elegans]CAB04068.2 Nuclear Hormone Receptor family [Caenorhabditis elegans]|eukprot:NP_507272.2 Nuclear Hormone Receptor family [Caenorhabditis elegans]